MKRTFLFCLIFCCFQTLVRAQQYVISAELTGFADRTKFYLKDTDAGIIIDSVEIKDGKFTMKGKSSEVKSFWLFARPNNDYRYTTFLIGPEKISIRGDIKDFPRHVQLTGSKNQDVANKLTGQTRDLWKSRDSLVLLLRPHIGQTPTDSLKAITNPIGKQISQIDSLLELATSNFIKENLNSHSGLREFYDKKRNYKRADFEALFNTVDPELKNSTFGKRIADYLKVGNVLKKGESFYDFEANNINGKKYRLSDYKGKYILLDFTETYCGPCILSTEDLKKLSAKYANQLQIISFYVEKDKKTIKEGLTRDKPTWPCLWDGKGTYSEIVLKYGVAGTPTFVVIDPEGKIQSRFSGFEKDENGKGSLANRIDKLLQP
ncbi:TlpA disulfide reductase family protein [Pedobacter sp. KR3-3]|uniref:TlpA disulfide reductase family protein n=1 Tax=Pedobacter albus TaxID=3113905 RepID=A0ABU7I7P6_9SPHI|nr:TlpA disulfide reductase family protein [Pedobacter sp. KR3-3]MEE1945409.1 TlpA disulfide reductase family protein [Pedobacter sp. KR3-3]